MEVGLDPGDSVLDGDPASPKKGAHLQFSTHVYCGQTAGWINLPLGTKVGVGPGHIVLDGNPARPQGAQLPNFRSMPVMAKPMDQDATWYGSIGLSPGDIMLDGDSSPPKKGHSRPPHFSARLLCPNGRPSRLLLRTCCDHYSAQFNLELNGGQPNFALCLATSWAGTVYIHYRGSCP